MFISLAKVLLRKGCTRDIFLDAKSFTLDLTNRREKADSESQQLEKPDIRIPEELKDFS